MDISLAPKKEQDDVLGQRCEDVWVARAVGGKHIRPPAKKGTLPETNIAHKNPPSKMVFTRKDGDFHGLC